MNNNILIKRDQRKQATKIIIEINNREFITKTNLSRKYNK